MTRIFFLLNEASEFDFQDHIRRYLPDTAVEVGTEMPERPSDYRLIVLWSIRSIIRNLPSPNNVILFHSSDLPAGKGWAPVYYALAENCVEFVISGIFAAPRVDSGDVIVKARFTIAPNYMASDIRRFDKEISILLVARILERFEGRTITGAAQRGLETFRPRRSPEDNKLDINQPFVELVPKLRACETGWPAFFDYEGERYVVQIAPQRPAKFPDKIDILFGEDAI